MMEKWYAIVEEVTGRLHSVGSVVADVLPFGLIKIPLEKEPTTDDMWDEKLQKFVLRPAKEVVDRLEDFLDQPGVREALVALTPAQYKAIVGAAIFVLGKRRYRNRDNDLSL